MNPNNCQTCRYKHMKETGATEEQHCYMFADEPSEACMQHTKPDLADFIKLTQQRPLSNHEENFITLLGRCGLL